MSPGTPGLTSPDAVGGSLLARMYNPLTILPFSPLQLLMHVNKEKNKIKVPYGVFLQTHNNKDGVKFIVFFR